jgi:hypothetical protein
MTLAAAPVRATRTIACRERERRIVVQNPGVKPLKFRTGIKCEIFVEAVPDCPVHGECSGLVTASVQRQHEMGGGLLTERILTEQGGQVRHDLTVLAQPEHVLVIGVLDDPASFFPPGGGRFYRRATETFEQLPAPQGERIVQGGGSSLKAPGSLRLGNLGLEHQGIDLGVGNRQPVTGICGLQDPGSALAGFPERTPEAGHRVLGLLDGGYRWVIWPHRVHQPADRRDPSLVEKQDCQDHSLAQSSDWQPPAVDINREVSEDTEVHVLPRPGSPR